MDSRNFGKKQKRENYEEREGRLGGERGLRRKKNAAFVAAGKEIK